MADTGSTSSMNNYNLGMLLTYEFVLVYSPKKFLHAAKDETYQLGLHELTGMSQLSEQVVRYDLDDLDVAWLRQLNEQREEVGKRKDFFLFILIM